MPNSYYPPCMLCRDLAPLPRLIILVGTLMTFLILFLGRDKDVNNGGKQSARQSSKQRKSDKALDQPGMNLSLPRHSAEGNSMYMVRTSVCTCTCAKLPRGKNGRYFRHLQLQRNVQNHHSGSQN